MSVEKRMIEQQLAGASKQITGFLAILRQGLSGFQGRVDFIWGLS
jgi:hypothetical protein